MTTQQEREGLVTMFDSLMALEEDAKAIKDEIRDTLETYAGNKEQPAKAIKELYKKYKEWKKNPEDFVLIDFTVDSLLSVLIPEYADGKEAV